MSDLTVDAILDGDDDTILQPRHIRQDCECRIVEAPVQRISEIIQNDCIPILSLQPTGTDKLGLVAKPFDGTVKYAVVWHRPDDEFASAQYSTITTCQLIRLADRLGALHLREGGVEICFWMQALCLPDGLADAEEDGASNLEDIYSKAYALLIMDSEWLLSRPPAQRTPYGHITHLKSDHPELTRASRILLIGPTGFHIEVDHGGRAAGEDAEPNDI